MRAFHRLESSHLDEVRGGAADPLGATALVAGRPQTCRAIEARADRLFAHGDDPTIRNEDWLRQYRKLRDGWMRLPSLEGCRAKE